MSIVATLSTMPVRDEGSTEEIATAIRTLDNYDVEYKINPLGTTIEASDISELFAAVQAAHQAIEADRVNTKLEIDHERNRDRDADERVATVEDALADNTTDNEEMDETTEPDEERDIVDMSGHAPEDIESEAEEDEINIKGGDYKTDEVDETEEESLSEKYDNS
ncbi:thiamine-binding protein [Halococcus sediminicola]|uniref:thiamine-binding protein n=1 Tax=Halococcus sediminicola TaxID=1264579 RepID=UPI0006798A3C|nr:thiamine-binding protein [Halococcus sediminicola]